MKMIWAVIRPEYAGQVIDALEKIGISALTRLHATGHGSEKETRDGRVSPAAMPVDSGAQERGLGELLQIPIRKNKKTLGWFGWHPRSPDMILPIDRQALETICILLALKAWHQQCIERAMESQRGFNDVFGRVSP